MFQFLCMAGHWTISCPDCGKTWIDRAWFLRAVGQATGDAAESVLKSGDYVTLPLSLARTIDLREAEKASMEAQGLNNENGSWVCDCGYEAYDVLLP